MSVVLSPSSSPKRGSQPLSSAPSSSSITTSPKEGEIKIHSADAFVEIIKNCRPMLPPHRKQIPPSRENLEREAAKDNIANKQRVREQEFLKTMETVKLQQERRIQENALAKEREFNQKLQSLLEEREGFVKDMAAMVKEVDTYKQRTKHELYHEWNRHVYHPLQQRINEHVSQLDMEEIGSRRRNALQAYLEMSRKKKGQVFRDIILEAEYDPVHFRTQNHMKYKAEIINDPCKPKSMRRRNQDKIRH
jgi:hypothetical protein